MEVLLDIMRWNSAPLIARIYRNISSGKDPFEDEEYNDPDYHHPLAKPFSSLLRQLSDPRGKSNPFYKAQYSMKNFCSKHSLDNNLFKVNEIRKHLASCTTSLDNDQQQVVSDFMGHSMAIHKNIYQPPLIQKDILTMGKILSQAGGYSTGDITTKELEPVTEAATIYIQTGWKIAINIRMITMKT
ncbi:hypothetical protein JTB14_008482 [Gonioctena quinquepunctata]|nr:hypothetical protein JTB14_008482 [Gonioctena quinquepunctata]